MSISNGMETPKNLLGNPPIKPQLKNNGSGGQLPKTEEGLSTTAKTVIFLAVILVGALILWFVLGGKEEAPEDALIGDNTSAVPNNSNQISDSAINKTKLEPVLVSGSNAIEADNQTPGNSVEVNMITLSVPGWAAIHEDKNGTLGNVLGAGRFDPGIHLGEIQLLRGTVSGGTYHAVLYQDDGDKMFDMSKDAPIKNAEGKIIESIFRAE